MDKIERNEGNIGIRKLVPFSRLPSEELSHYFRFLGSSRPRQFGRSCFGVTWFQLKLTSSRVWKWLFTFIQSIFQRVTRKKFSIWNSDWLLQRITSRNEVELQFHGSAPIEMVWPNLSINMGRNTSRSNWCVWNRLVRRGDFGKMVLKFCQLFQDLEKTVSKLAFTITQSL